VCTGNLAAKTAPAGNNSPDAFPNGSSVILDFFNTLAADQTLAGTWTWSSTITCGSPTPCTSGAVSPGNGDGSSLLVQNDPTSPDPIYASDIDFNAGAAGLAPTVAAYAPSGGLPPDGAVATFDYFNDGPVAIGALTISGTATASGTTTITGLSFTFLGGTGGLMVCNEFGIASNSRGWTCTGALTADLPAAGAGDDAFGPDLASRLNFTVEAEGVGVAGDTITFTPNAPVCTNPGACTNNVASPANMDGGTTIVPPVAVGPILP
jgi:hypothetical protein